MVVFTPFVIWISIFLFILIWLAYTRLKGAEYAPTTRKKAEKMIEFARLGKEDRVYELGSGLGGLCIRSSREANKVIGIEYDPIRVLISKLRIKFLGTKNIKFKRGDIFKDNFSDANVVLMFLNPESTNRLKDKFEKLKKGTRIISNIHKIEGWKPIRESEKLEIYLYVVGKSNLR